MNQQTIDIPSESQALIVRPEQPAPALFRGEPSEVVQHATAAADALKAVIVKQGLVSRISGKEYPRCEAWTLLGSMLGVFPVCQWTRPIDGGWEARVEARTLSGAVIGAAEAQCLRSERNWSNRDDFALRSMAQTRATAKCLRMPLGFVMTLAGYEPTPAEEMVADHARTPQSPAPARPQSGPMGFTSDEIKSAQRTKPALPTCATEKTRAWMISQLKAGPGTAERMIVTEYAQKSGILLPDVEELEQWPLEYVPISTAQLKLLAQAIADFEAGEDAKKPFPANPLFGVRSSTVTKSDRKVTAPQHTDAAKPAGVSPAPAGDFPPETQVPRDANPDPNAPDAPWRSFPVPFGKHAGTSLADLDKATLFGFWANFEPQEKWQDREGNLRDVTPMKLAKDRKFRQMLDEAGKHYEFRPPADTED